jgi:hypothetical protein
MGLTFLTGYVLGQHGTQSARLAATAAGQTGSSASEMLDLHDRVDRLILVLDAMWSLLEDAGYSDEQLKARIEEIDSSDGVLDGKRTFRAVQCGACEAKIAPGLPSCQFCGTKLPESSHDPISNI